MINWEPLTLIFLDINIVILTWIVRAATNPFNMSKLFICIYFLKQDIIYYLHTDYKLSVSTYQALSIRPEKCFRSQKKKSYMILVLWGVSSF